MSKHEFRFEKGAKVIATMIDGHKVPSTITKRTYNHFNGQNYYTIQYEAPIVGTMDGVPEDKIELA